MNYKKGDLFYHKDHSTIFMVHSIKDNMYTLFFPTGHPTRDKPWARYDSAKMEDVAMQVTDKKAEKAMRILYGRQLNKS